MRAWVLTLLSALLLAGCANDPGSEPSQATPDPDATPSQATPSALVPGIPTAVLPAPEAPSPRLALAFAHAVRNATPGHAVTFPVTLTHQDEAGAVVVRLEGAGVQGSVPALFSPGSPATYFLTVDVAAHAAPGERRLTAVVVDAAGRELLRREDAATVVVRAAGDGYEPGDVGRVVYTGRLAETGAAFNTNDPAIERLSFSKTSDYSFSHGGTLPVTSFPRPSVVQGFHEAVMGMAPGESRTVTFPPEKGYGNATIEDRVPRENVVPRRESIPLPETTLPTEEFAEYLNRTDQGVPADYEVGEAIISAQGGETLRYRIVEKTDAFVRLRLDVAVGDRFTLYAFLGNVSEVVSLNDTHVDFLTTPAAGGDEPMTFHAYWPDASRIVGVNETSIVIRHDPPMGLRYTKSTGMYAPPAQHTVTAMEEKEIVSTTPGTHPLSGEALTFDILLAELVKDGNDG